MKKRPISFLVDIEKGLTPNMDYYLKQSTSFLLDAYALGIMAQLPDGEGKGIIKEKTNEIKTEIIRRTNQ